MRILVFDSIKKKNWRNDMSTIFLQQILNDKLLLLGQKSNLSVSLKFESIITNHL